MSETCLQKEIGSVFTSRRTKFALLLIVVLVAAYSVYSYWETIPYEVYEIGDEMKGFPANGMSLTVTQLSTAQDTTFPTSSEDIILNVTIRNTTNSTLYLNRGDLLTRLNQFSSSTNLVLQYKIGGSTGGKWSKDDNDWLGVFELGIPNSQITALESNQSLMGSIQYTLGDGNYSSFQLVCRQTSQTKPLFIVNLGR